MTEVILSTNSIYMVSTDFCNESLCEKTLLKSRSSLFIASVSALFQLKTLQGTNLANLGLTLMVMKGMPSWSLIPGYTQELSISVGLLVRKRSRMLFRPNHSTSTSHQSLFSNRYRMRVLCNASNNGCNK